MVHTAAQLNATPVINAGFFLKQADINVALDRIRQDQGRALFPVGSRVYYWAAIVQEAFRRYNLELTEANK